jgi:hypothetical protein
MRPAAPGNASDPVTHEFHHFGIGEHLGADGVNFLVLIRLGSIHGQLGQVFDEYGLDAIVPATVTHPTGGTVFLRPSVGFAAALNPPNS